MHHLRLELRGPDEAAEAIRDRLRALGAEPADQDGRLLLLASAAPPADVKRHVMADVPRGRIDAEHFELLGRVLHVERWNPKSIGQRSSRRLDVPGEPDAYDARWPRTPWDDLHEDQPPWRFEGTRRERPAELAPAIGHAVDAVLGAPRPAGEPTAEDVLDFLVGLGRLAASRSVDDPSLLTAASFLLDRGARAAARTRSAADVPFERALLLTRAAWSADRHPVDEPLLTTLQELAGAAERLVAWSRSSTLLTRAGAAPTCRTALAACLRTMAASVDTDLSLSPA